MTPLFIDMKTKPLHIAILLVATLLSAGAEPLIIGHRGASFVAPENTVASIREAWKEGADGTEMDIYLTKDGRIVTFHDKTLTRTAEAEGEIKDKTLAELQKLDAGSWKDARWKGEKIPTLEESLAAVPEGKIIYIELKSGPEILPELKRVLDASPKKREEIFLIDFKLENLVAAKPLFPDIRKLWIVGGKRQKDSDQRVYPPIEGLVEKALAAGMDGLDLEWRFPLDEKSVASIKEEKLLLAVWTVNEAEDAKRLAAAGVEAITTDRPEFIREALKK